MMGARNTPQQWGWVAKTLHWATALAVIGLVIVGLLMDDMPNSPAKVKVFALHKSVGLTVLAIVVLRLLWRLVDRRPPYPATMPGWQRVLSEISHALLYVLLFTQTLSGWLYNSASNFALRWFNLFSVPALSGPDKQLKHLANEIHETGWIILALLMAIHVAAAIKHHFIDRDITLARMVPGLKPPLPKDTP
jgi:cytochrome b561